MSDVVTGQFRNKRQWLWVAAFVAVIVLGAGVGVGLRAYQNRRHSDVAVTKTPAASPSIASVAQDQALGGDYSGAQATISTALQKRGLTDSEKYDLYSQQGTTYQNQGNNQAALDSFKQAAGFKKTQGLYESMAVVAHSLGDDTSAIAYYKQAIQLISTNSPLHASYKANDEQAIKQLGGTP